LGDEQGFCCADKTAVLFQRQESAKVIDAVIDA
jgi:hypothetical protein